METSQENTESQQSQRRSVQVRTRVHRASARPEQEIKISRLVTLEFWTFYHRVCLGRQFRMHFADEAKFARRTRDNNTLVLIEFYRSCRKIMIRRRYIQLSTPPPSFNFYSHIISHISRQNNTIIINIVITIRV